MKFIEDVEIEGKKVFIRVDFNVPMSDGKVTDDTRIRAGLETIEYALSKNAIVIVGSHLGRPKSFDDLQFSLKPVAQRLGELLQKNVKMADNCIGSSVEELINSSEAGDVIMLENLRFYPQEKKDEEEFASKLASLCDVYVNNAFAVCHRKNASVSKIVDHVSVAVAGHLLKSEIENYDKAVNNPKRPLLAIIGGAKVSSKLGALKNIMNKVDMVLIGGAMANTFFAAKGFSIGKSLYEPEMMDAANEIVELAKQNNVDLVLPIDGIVAEKCEVGAEFKEVMITEIPENMQMLDIGKKSVELFSKSIDAAATIVWNGPMGVFEIDSFAKGTFGVAESVANCSAFTIIGGGDTDAAVHKAGLVDKMDYISTGGGAFLTLMEGNPLPAVEALLKKN